MTLSLAPMEDFIILGAFPSPGRAIVRPANSPRDWDIRKGYGFSGATIVYTGAGLAKFEVDITLWDDPIHWTEWDIFAPILAKPVPPVVTGIDIVHPLLNMAPWNITSVVVEDVSGFEESDYEEFTCTIKFIQFRAPVPALGKPDVSIKAVNDPVPTPQDAYDDTIIANNKAITAAFLGDLFGGFFGS
jgi:hypothetical protein